MLITPQVAGDMNRLSRKAGPGVTWFRTSSQLFKHMAMEECLLGAEES